MSKQLLFEDVLNFQDKWGSSASTRSVGPEKMTLMDMLRKSPSDQQNPNNQQAPPLRLHGSEMMVELLGDLYVQTMKVKSAISTIKTNPVLRNRSKSHASLIKILKKLSLIQKVVKLISRDIEHFEVDKPKI